jgi:hypothetical protein
LFLKIGPCVSVLPNAGKEDFSDHILKEAGYSQLIPGLRQQALQIKPYACDWHYVISSNSQSSITLAVPVRLPR